MRELARHERGRGKRFPDELRRRAGEWIRTRRAEGATLREISDELGLCYETVRRWSELVASESTALVPVVVERRPAEIAAGDLTLQSPAGFRIEGLTLAQAIAALRELG